jgi:hypothetical protein
MPLQASQERLKMRGVAAEIGQESPATATKASPREYLVIFTTQPLSDRVAGAVPDQGGVRVAVELASTRASRKRQTRFRRCGSRRASTFDVMAAARFLSDQRGEGDDRTWDIGGRWLWQPSLELAISVESLRRGGTRFSAGDSSNRTVGMLEYRVYDDIVLYGSFGKDFEDLPGARTLVSIIGVNLGFGRKPIVDVAR